MNEKRRHKAKTRTLTLTQTFGVLWIWLFFSIFWLSKECSRTVRGDFYAKIDLQHTKTNTNRNQLGKKIATNICSITNSRHREKHTHSFEQAKYFPYEPHSDHAISMEHPKFIFIQLTIFASGRQCIYANKKIRWKEIYIFEKSVCRNCDLSIWLALDE